MFSEKKATEPQVFERNLIAKSTSINGDIKSQGDFRIDGEVDGTIITSGKVIIGVEGIVKGSIECTSADIEGTFTGKMTVSDLLFLKATANVSGEIAISRLSVEPGATFNATCEMKDTVKKINPKTAVGKSKEEKQHVSKIS